MKRLRKPHIRGGRFYNHKDENRCAFFLHSLQMLFRYYALLKKKPSKGEACWVDITDTLRCSINPVITWIGHASFLVQLGGVNILLDPIFGDVSFFYRRILPVGFSINQIPKIDFVLISHNHRDHMDAPSLLAIKKQNESVTVLVPKGDKAWFDRRRFAQVHEHTWWEQRSFKIHDQDSREIIFTFLPAAHWSQRGLFDQNRSLWGSWMIEWGDNQIYFGGDSCYSTHFTEISREFSDINMALLPVGPCEPRGWLKETHLGAEEAGQAFLDLGAQHMIPMHWGMFPFGVEHFDNPIKLMQLWWQKNQKNLKDRQLHCVKVGQPVLFDKESVVIQMSDQKKEK